MKKYIQNIAIDLMQFSKSLDMKAFLLNKPWALIDSDLSIQKLIFNRNNELILSKNGSVSYGKWDYFPQARSILIDRGTDIILCNEIYVDDNVLVLKKDGTRDSLIILANENNIPDLDAYTYLNNLSYEKLGIKYILLTNNKVLWAQSNQYNQIGIGSTIKYDTGSVPNDGEYLQNDEKIQYVITNGEISKIRKFELYKAKSGDVLIIEVKNDNPFEIGVDVSFHKNANVPVNGIFYIEIKNEKIILDVISGTLKAIFYMKEFIDINNVKLTFYSKSKYDLNCGDQIFINNQIAPNRKYKLDGCSITVKDGVISKIYNYSIYPVVVTIILVIVSVIIAAIA